MLINWKNTLLIFALAVSCAEPGDTSEEGNEQDSTTGEEVVELDQKEIQSVNVGLRPLFGKEMALSSQCLQTTFTHKLEVVNEIVVDGEVQDWLGESWTFSDPVSDGASELDLINMQFGLSPSHFLTRLEISRPLKSDESAFLEFYVMKEGQGIMSFVPEALFEYKPSESRVFVSGGWQLLRPEFSQWHLSSENIETSLARPFIVEGILKARLFGVRVGLIKQGRVVDSSSSILFSGLEEDEEHGIEVGGCFQDARNRYSFHYQEIRSPSVNPSLAKYIFGQARFVEKLISKELVGFTPSVKSIPIILSDSSIEVAPIRLPETGPLTSQFKDQVIVVDVNRMREYGQRNLELQTLIAYLSRFFDILDQNMSEDDKPLHELVKGGVISSILMKNFNITVWLDYIYQDTLSVYQKLGILLEQGIGSEDILIAWREARRLNEPQASFWRLLTDRHGEKALKIKGLFDESAAALVQGLVEFRDDDADGLPGFFEKKNGTNENAVDSDADGWSDLAEWLEKKDQLNNLDKPEIIMPDGIVGDYLELVPGLIKPLDESQATGCPNAANLLSVVGMQSKEWVTLAGTFESLPQEKAAREQGVRFNLELRVNNSKERRLVTFSRFTKILDVLDEKGRVISRIRHLIPLGVYAIDVALSAQEMGWEEIPQGVELKLSAIKNDATLAVCDESPWIRLVKLVSE